MHKVLKNIRPVLFFSLIITLMLAVNTFIFSLITPPVYGQTANAWNLQRTGTSDLNMYYGTNTALSNVALQLTSSDAKTHRMLDLDNESYLVDPSNTTTSIGVAGNVGIGIATPTTRLHIVGTGNGNILGQFLAPSAADASSQQLILGQSSNAGRSGIFGFTLGTSAASYADSASWIVNYGDGQAAQGITLKKGGNLGVGTATPDGKLDVAGFLKFSANGTNPTNMSNTIRGATGGSLEFRGGTTGYSFINANNTSTLATITNQGNVGINTTTPSQKLEIAGDLGSGGPLTLLRLRNTNATGVATGIDFLTQYGGTDYTTAQISSGAYGNYGGQFLIQVSNASRTLVNRLYIASDGSTIINGNTSVVGSVSTCNIGNGTSATMCSSDAKLKKDVANISPTLNNILALRPITFTWKDPEKPQDTHMGFIAQEAEKLFPDLVKTGPDGYKMFEYGGLVTPLVKAMQELNTQITSIWDEIALSKTKIESLSQQLNNQQAEIDELRHELEKLKNQ